MNYLSLVSFFFDFHFVFHQDHKSTIQKVHYFVNWSSHQDLVVYLYPKIPEKFVRLIFQDGSWFAYNIS